MDANGNGSLRERVNAQCAVLDRVPVTVPGVEETLYVQELMGDDRDSYD